MIKFYKKAADGIFVLGDVEYNFVYTGQFYYLDRNPYLAIFRSSDNEKLFDSPYTEYEKENGDPYSSFADLETLCEDFFFNSGGVDQVKAVDGVGLSAIDITMGLYGCQIVTGSTKTSIKTGFYAFACTCRVDGSIIASLEKTIDNVISNDTDEAITTIAMYQGEYQPFINKVVSVTQTAAGDSITYWLKPL